MDSSSKQRSSKSGMPAGSLIHIGEKKVDKIKIKLVDYGTHEYIEKDIDAEDIEQCFGFKDDKTITWINIDGIHETEILNKLGKCFGFHPLILEDILNTEQRPKVEDFNDYIYIVLKMINYNNKHGEINLEQVSIIVGSNYVISLQEKPLKIYEPIRTRLKNDKSRIRNEGSDYLAYLLIDSIIDNYFDVLEKIGEKIEIVENKLVVAPTQKTLKTIYDLKRDMLFMRKSTWPVREVISKLERGEISLISSNTRIYIRDIYDHIIQVIDSIETFRDMLSGMIDIYLSSISNRLNEVMKILTIISTIFIPITFIASIYGMNFKFMPEIPWKWSYPTVWIIIIAIIIYMVIYFKRKKWF
ncbi:MAG: magnesium/cobalt transporter CorA [Actinomycetota bacterium]|nr:magnesium/cobalt transporter CorA [Actinomycetota bacterium]